ncbi:MFS transporter [Streptomyces sp. NPDC059009]|uniref:MFS transporter n=1 Tax=Streptomyces sp. NPDC059009 TaxID=3346694 RepID=UPI0036CC1090
MRPTPEPAGAPTITGGAATRTTPPPAAAGSRRAPQLRTLLVAQAIGALGLSAGGTAGPLIAGDIMGSTALTTLPLGLLVLGTAGSAPLTTALMRRHGRAAGLAAAYAVATAGALLVIAAAATGSAALLLFGSFLLGTGNTAVMLGRYVAADAAPAAGAGRAVSTVMTAVTVGAVIGPALMGPAEVPARALGLPGATGLFLLAALNFPTAAIVTLRLQLRLRRTTAHTPRSAAPAAAPRPAPGRRGSRVPLPALAVMGCANLTMVTAMAAAPVHLHAHHWTLQMIGVLVAGHVLLMFGPSALTGRLNDRVGGGLTALCGATVLLMALPLVALASTIPAWATVVGILLLGLGWNTILISGSALVVQRTPAEYRHRAEGLGESAMGLGAVLGTVALAGPLIDAGGLPLLCLVLGAVTVLSVLPLLKEIRG